MPNRILLADDHVIVRQGLKALLEREGFTVIAEAEDGQAAVRAARERCPDVAVLDFSMPLLNGRDAAREILQVCPRAKAILLTMHTEDHYVLEALQIGVKGYVVKSQASGDLVRAINEVQRGMTYLSPGVSQTVVQAFLSKAVMPRDPLTSREREVLQLVAEGKSTKEIAQLLAISFKTAESHRTRIMKKTDIHETAGLVRYAVRRGLIQP
ncbi:MAG: DNA-binding response regulator [Candidatus Rokuibacteriota bacterium]|nr:MAG: DNA-binding response regulator [Candidatus Rokubacteria bacterium]PYN56497.1 MAG: DNA-binding response regulator [Candidatus Rokubacteria bacterium]